MSTTSQTQPMPASPTAATTNAALIALFAALIAALGLFPSVYSQASGGVPFTMQTLGVMIAGGVLGWWRGFLSVALFVGLVAAGLHLLAGGRGGIEVFQTPSVGYLIGFPFGAMAIGAIAGNSTNIVRIFLATFIGGIGVVYLFGIPGIALNLDISLAKAWDIGKVFFAWDMLKVVFATFVIANVRTSGLLGGGAAARPDA